jgi:hypothetical protein
MRNYPMPILRLAYITQFLIALITIFVMWGQVGGQSHLELLPWFVKLGLGVAAAYAVVRATQAAVAGPRGWNAQSVRWLGIALVFLFLCGMASYFAHMYLEDDEQDNQEQDTTVSRFLHPSGAYFTFTPAFVAPASAATAVAAFEMSPPSTVIA